MLITVVTVALAIAVGGLAITARAARAERHYTAARKLHGALTRSPGARLAIRRPVIDDGTPGTLRVSGRVHVDVIDMDGRTTDRFRTGRVVLDVPVGAGIAAAAETDGVRTMLLHVIDGEVDTVDLELTCGMRLASSRL